jgi:ketosteroid isomerase-like protein
MASIIKGEDMATGTSLDESAAVRLQQAVNHHDLNALADCFAPDFVNETPLHPARSFRGREQVRKNWAQIFAAVPDMKADLLGSAHDGNTVWTEWELSGTRLDGARHLMRGVSVFRIEDGVIASVRFYLEPVEQGGAGVDAAVQEVLSR